jgi:hypothetical protein
MSRWPVVASPHFAARKTVIDSELCSNSLFILHALPAAPTSTEPSGYGITKAHGSSSKPGIPMLLLVLVLSNGHKRLKKLGKLPNIRTRVSFHSHFSASLSPQRFCDSASGSDK